jgi:hypothetical protein
MNEPELKLTPNQIRVIKDATTTKPHILRTSEGQEHIKRYTKSKKIQNTKKKLIEKDLESNKKLIRLEESEPELESKIPTVFKEISTLWPILNTATNKDEKEEDRKTSFKILFNTDNIIINEFIDKSNKLREPQKELEDKEQLLWTQQRELKNKQRILKQKEKELTQEEIEQEKTLQDAKEKEIRNQKIELANQEEKLEQIKKKERDELTDLDITLTNNDAVNLYDFFTKALFFSSVTYFINETETIDIASVITQLGKDLHRMSISINDEIINKDEFMELIMNEETGNEERKAKEGSVNVEYFNKKLKNVAEMSGINEDKITNIISTIDVCSIQQIISVVSDMICNYLAPYSIIQKDSKKGVTVAIIINPMGQYVETSIISPLIVMSPTSVVPFINWGTFTGTLKMDIENLTYSFHLIIEKDKISPTEQANNTQKIIEQQVSNMGIGAINYVKENPTQVATGVGTASILGSSVGALLLAGVLGGKTKKRKNIKIVHKNRKTVRKNKPHKTRKTIYKNKRRKTKRRQK